MSETVKYKIIVKKFTIKRKRHVKRFVSNAHLPPGMEYTVSFRSSIYVIRKDLNNQVSILSLVGDPDSLCSSFVEIANKDKKTARNESVEDMIWKLRKPINKQLVEKYKRVKRFMPKYGSLRG